MKSPPTDISTEEAVNVERTRLSALFASHIGTLEQRIWVLQKINAAILAVCATLLVMFIIGGVLFVQHQLDTNNVIELRLNQLEQER